MMMEDSSGIHVITRNGGTVFAEAVIVIVVIVFTVFNFAFTGGKITFAYGIVGRQLIG